MNQIILTAIYNYCLGSTYRYAIPNNLVKNDRHSWVINCTQKVLFVFVFAEIVQLILIYKNHDSPAAGGDQQASLTWAAGGLRVAERNGAGMERKVLSAAKPCSIMKVK
ncbi:MAG: hypothetical protein AB2L24_19530 [Mangrovibacterium sp.]